MQRCTYRVLEFAKSERELHGLIVAVLIRFDDLQEEFFKSFYLNGWQGIIGDEFEPEIAYTQDALYYFRRYAHKHFAESEEVLSVTGNMSVGPLRTTLAGAVTLPPFEEIHCELHERQDTQTCSGSSFSALVNALLERSVAGSAS